MLSLDDCKWLASVGMDIIVQPGDYVHNNELYDDEHAYRIPSLQELIEFAEDTAGFAIILRYNSMSSPHWYAAESHEIETGGGDTPESAVVALICKLMEGRDGY